MIPEQQRLSDVRFSFFVFNDDQRRAAELLRLGVVAAIADQRGMDQRLAFWTIDTFFATLCDLERAREIGTGATYDQVRSSSQAARNRLREARGAFERPDAIGCIDALRPITLHIQRRRGTDLRPLTFNAKEKRRRDETSAPLRAREV